MKLPTYANTLEDYTLTGTPLIARAPKTPLTRTAFAAAHVISDPLAERDPWMVPPAVDWEATLKFRHFLWDQGLGLAEAMDTAQRMMGTDWPTAKELIERTMVEAKAHPMKPRVACGAGTDHVDLADLTTEDAIVKAYEQQMEAIEAAGGQSIIMASRAMAAVFKDGDAYERVYDRLISSASQPVILHWLGDMFDPALAGYWGSTDILTAEKTVLNIINRHADKVEGIKISLLETAHEVRFRRQLPDGVVLYTGDDFNYAELIEGDEQGYSHALLGIFAAISPAAAQGLEALAEGNTALYHSLLAPTVPLSREIFKAPTRFYKAGVAFLAWLNGQQSHFIMPGGFQSSREIAHYAEVFRLADQANLLLDPDLAQKRMGTLLALHGIE